MSLMVRDAVISTDQRYRYWLTRVWTPDPSKRLVWVMLNPSTADGLGDDPTVRRIVNYSKDWGYHALDVVNLFAFRTPSPEALVTALQTNTDIVGPQNDEFLGNATKGHDVVVAWGDNGAKYPARVKDVFGMLVAGEARIHHLGVTGKKQPRHPLYLKKDLKLTPL